MKDSLTSFNREDFRQRYKGCFGFLLHEGQRKLVYIKEVGNGQVTFITSSKGPEFYALANENVEFEFLPIQRSWYNLGTHPGLLFRIPAKQYHRGISSNNTAFYVPTKDGYVSAQHLSLEVLSKVFPCPLPNNSVKFFKGEQDHLVLNRAFCITGSHLYFFAEVAGTYNSATRTIKLRLPIVHQELLDTIRRQQLPISVEVAE